jgi:hypothetical protein
MNEELLAANVLFVQSGALLVNHNGSAPAARQVILTTLAAPQSEL